MNLKNSSKYFILLITLLIPIFFTIDYLLKNKIEYIKKDKFTTISQNIEALIEQSIKDKSFATLNIAISTAEYSSVNGLLSYKNRDKLDSLKNVSKKIKNNSNFKNIWFQLIDKNGYSLYRSWSPKKGDDLLQVRKELTYLLKEPKISSVISIGIFDLTFKSIVPIYENGEFIGLLETITKFNSIAKKLEKKGIDLLVIVDKKYKQQLTKPFTKLFIDDYYIANYNAKKELLALTKDNLEPFLNTEEYKVHSNKFISSYILKDIDGNKMATILAFQDYSKIFSKEIKNLEDFIEIITYLLVLIIISIFAIYYYFNKSKYTKTLEKEVKKRTIELNELIKRYKQLFEGSKAIKILVDPSSSYIYDANKAALAFYGYTKDEIKKLKSSDINISTKNSDEIFDQILNEKKNIFIFKHRLANNTLKDVEVYSSAIDMGGKKLIYSIIRDITEDLKLQKEFEEKQKLFYQQAKMASMGEMLENIAHQWRQPLSTITTAASGIKLKKEFDQLDDESFEESVDIILKSANFLSKTIDDFRNFFKHSNSLEKFRVIEAVEDSFNILKLKLSANSIKISIKDSANIEIDGYKNEFMQVFLNLINNSIDIFKIKDIKKRVILVKLKKCENHLIITFLDSANGIKESIIDKIFEPYFTTKHQYSGTGIGLYMSEQIIEKHFLGEISVENSEFEVESKKYFGAKFTIKLPLKRVDN